MSSSSTDGFPPITCGDADPVKVREDLYQQRRSLLSDLKILEKNNNLEYEQKEENRQQLAQKLDKVRDQLTRLDQEEQRLATDLKRRIVSLLDAYECSATEEGWRSLALQLAIRHGEPGFEINFASELKPSARNRMEDEHLRWDDMIGAHVNPPAGSGAPRRTQREAAELVADVLEKEWEARGRTGQKPKKARYLEKHYSERKCRLSDDDPRNLPLYLLRHIHLSNVFRALMTAAQRVRKPAYKKR